MASEGLKPRLFAALSSWGGWLVLLVAFLSLPALLGVAATVAFTSPWNPVLRSVGGLVLLLWGVGSLFRLAAFDSTRVTESRSRGAGVGAGMVLLGAAQIAFDVYLRAGLMLAALAVATVVLVGRARSFLARSRPVVAGE